MKRMKYEHFFFLSRKQREIMGREWGQKGEGF
jgi:hypothetical protein